MLPSGFIPTEDQGIIYANVTTPPGSTVERTGQVLDEIQRIAEKFDAVDNISTLAGYSLATEVSGASYGMGMINMKAWDERKESVSDLIRILQEKTKHIKDANIEFRRLPLYPVSATPVVLSSACSTKQAVAILSRQKKWAKDLIAAATKTGVVGNAFTSFNPNFPQYMIHVDQDVAAKKGVTIDNAMSTLQTLLRSYYATNFIRFGQMYKVMVQAYPQYRSNPEDILRLYVKNDKGEMVPFNTFIRMERVF